MLYYQVEELYEEYVDECEALGVKPLSMIDWWEGLE